jgi:hypothetical protein
VPNWCHNTLSVQGPADRLQEFADKVKLDGIEDGKKWSIPLSFSAHVPDAAAGDDWYEWRIQHWGTKWDASFGGSPMVALGAEGMDIEKSVAWTGVRWIDDELVFKFDTAWSPPYPWAQRASELEPDLTFGLRWAEVGHDAAGEAVWQSGLTIEENDLKVEDVLEPEEMWF